jgi:DNA polymerase III delta subunit
MMATRTTPPRLVVRTTLATFAVVAFVLSAVLALIAIQGSRYVRSTVSDKLAAGQRMLSALEQRQSRELQAQVATLAENSTLKAAIDTYRSELTSSSGAARAELVATIRRELDKLALRHAVDEGPVTADDVRALVAETTPASVWALSDAVGERRVDVAATALERLLESTPEPVLLAVLHRRIVELLELGDRMASGAKLPEAARAMGITSEYRAKTLAAQARKWSTGELTAALHGLVELDAMVKGAPGYETDVAQRKLAFLLWIRDHTGGRGLRGGPG